MLMLALAACAQRPLEPEVFGQGPMNLTVQPPQLGAQLWQARANSALQDGLLSSSTSYGLRRADLPAGAASDDWLGPVATESFRQQFSARLPQTPLQLGWELEQQRALASNGVAAARSERARLLWSPADFHLQLATDPRAGGYQLDASHARQLGNWKLSTALALGHAAAPASTWGGRASLQRELWRTPVSASWQRNASVSSASREAAFALDLSPQLRRWVWPGLSGDLSYRYLLPEDADLAADARLQMGFKFDWR